MLYFSILYIFTVYTVYIYYKSLIYKALRIIGCPSTCCLHAVYTVYKHATIATIATILASNAINLKNIGIVHNREFEEGVLRIEFYDEDSSKKAAEILQKFRYIVYER